MVDDLIIHQSLNKDDGRADFTSHYLVESPYNDIRAAARALPDDA
ncbi:hypothetical protein J31TS3_15080 [Paenibacillus lactis]|nr:hypothetical protein J31TS3_15080 [Paenibacillus lactis]